MKLSHEDMYKVAVTVNTLDTVGTFLTKTMPKAFKGIRGAAKTVGLTAANANKAGLIGGAIGGAGGAVSGMQDQNPETRGTSMAARAAIGATAGYFGGKGLANKMPTFGKHYEAAFKPVGQKMLSVAKNTKLTGGQRGQQVMDFAAQHLNPQHTTEGIKGITTKNFFGHGNDTPAVAKVTNPHLPWGAKVFGDIARVGQNVRQEGVVKGISNTLKQNWNEAKMFDKKISDKPNAPTYRFNRSAAGRIVNPLITAGVGMGITDAAMATNDNGSKPTIGKRLRTGAKSTLAWGVTPHLMMGKMVAYDIPKTIMGGSKQPPQDLNTIGV